MGADPDDADLVRRSQRDPAAFALLFDRYYAPVKRYVLRRVLDHDLASDIVSETFLKAFAGLPRYRWKGVSFGAWLYRIALNEIRQGFRRQRYQPRRLDDLASFNAIDRRLLGSAEEEREAWDRELHDHDAFIRASRIIGALPEHYQVPLSLRYFGEKSIAEIAAILDKPEGTVKSLLARGLEKVRAAMQPGTH